MGKNKVLFVVTNYILSIITLDNGFKLVQLILYCRFAQNYDKLS